MSGEAPLFKDSLGARNYSATILYALLMYGLGLAGILHTSYWVNGIATLMLAHGMIISAYLIHECGHNLVFSRAKNNARLGTVMSWLCGASYGTYEDIRYKHFRHHVDNDDVVWFDYDKFFEDHPKTTRVIRALEWFYVPAHDLLMHGVMVLTSFVIPQRRNQRLRNVAVIVVRSFLFALLAFLSVKAAVLYIVAYLLLVHVLRFADSVQHDYPYNTTLFETSRSPQKGNKVWEQEHTFSNPISLRYPFLNLLTLNFGYHNAHHADMNLPFFRLPALHEELTGNDVTRVIPLAAQLRLYHVNRVSRIYNPQPDDYPQGETYLRVARSGDGAVGGNAASFLTSF